MVLLVGMPARCHAQNKPKSQPAELDVLKSYVGTWDADIEVWPQGPDATSIKLKGVEKNRAYGKYWLASDLDSQFMGQTMKVHSIVGFDVDQKQLVGKVIDDGMYAAKMVGRYDPQSKIVHWTTTVKNASGEPLVQKTTISHKNPGERLLVLSVPGKKNKPFTKFMQIKFTKRK